MTAAPSHDAQNAARWRVSIEKAAQWNAMVTQDTHIATGMHIVLRIMGVQGLLVALSTPRSCQVSKENQVTSERGGAITEPHWLYWEVYWYPGVALLNFVAISQSRRAERGIPHTLKDMLEDHFKRKCMPHWRAIYCCMQHGYFLETLRRMLRQEFDAHNWAEFAIGYSREEYRALDCYVTIESHGMQPSEYVAWFLLNATEPPEQRHELSPEDWWVCTEYKSWDQREKLCEWYLEITGAIMPAQQQRRMNAVLKHVSPPGLQLTFPKGRMPNFIQEGMPSSSGEIRP